MDRFFFYLLGAMAAVLLAAIGVVYFSRNQVAAEGSDAGAPPVKSAPLDAAVAKAPAKPSE